MPSEDTDLILIDTHVHLHDCFDVGRTLDAAYRNFMRVSADRFEGHPFTGVLFLTEGPGQDGFERLRRECNRQKKGLDSSRLHWRVQETDEEVSLRLVRQVDQELFVIAGSQIPTQNGLEVLILGSKHRFGAYRPIEETLSDTSADRALKIIPWGFGKDIGKRRRILSRILGEPSLERVCVGDNANRLDIGRSSFILRTAKQRGIPVLSGSDPLPFPSEESRPGCYGNVLRIHCSRTEPARDVLGHLLALDESPESYGSREKPLRFLKNQLAMQFKNRRSVKEST